MFLSVAPRQYFLDGALQIVEQTDRGNATKVGKPTDQAVQKRLLLLIMVSPDKLFPTGRPFHAEKIDTRDFAIDPHIGLTPVELKLLAQRKRQWEGCSGVNIC